MAEEPLNFDVATLEGLARIKSEQQSLRDLAQRAAEHREKVTEVYTRVVRDYEARIRALEEQAQQLRGQLREEFARLEDQYAQAREAVAQARFDLQESEFRKEIGEYTLDEFKRRQQAIEASIAERQGDLDRIGQLRGRFLELLPAEAAAPPAAPNAAAPSPVTPAAPPAAPAATATVQAPPLPPARAAEPPTPPPVVPLPTPQPIAASAPPVTSVAAAVPPGRPAGAEPPPAIPAVAGAGIGETMVLPPPGSAIFRMPAMPSGDEGATQILAPPSAGTKSAPSSATMAIPMASLVEEKAGGAPVTHRLGALTTIGRTPDNQVVIPSREVSRKHAEVILGEAGHVLRDLGSPNGTFVNGKKITEQPLKDGDSITIAGVTLVFRAK